MNETWANHMDYIHTTNQNNNSKKKKKKKKKKKSVPVFLNPSFSMLVFHEDFFYNSCRYIWLCIGLCTLATIALILAIAVLLVILLKKSEATSKLICFILCINV